MIGKNSVNISDSFHFHSANINGMLGTQNYGGE